ncbi:hypothetical protein B5S33_g4771 [[Candida] boidinii]|nr:hypothetical protein B5S33_g4771 [[Candida] boidinii]
MGLISSVLKIPEILIILVLAITLIDIIFIKPRKIIGLPVVSGYDFPIIGNLYLIFPQFPDNKLNFFLFSKRGRAGNNENRLYDIDGNKFEYLQTSTCLKFEKLSEKYGPVYQLRFGERNIVIANSYESIMKLWSNNNTRANNSRPSFYSFHELLSKSKLYTVGTTPFGSKYLNQRRFLVNNLMNNQNLINIVDYETEKLINYLKDQIINNNELGKIELDFTKIFQYCHFLIAVKITYGIDFEDFYNDFRSIEFVDVIIEVENSIVKLRSHINNFENYLPSVLRNITLFFKRILIKDDYKMINELYHKRKNYLNRLDELYESSRFDVYLPEYETELIRNSMKFKFEKYRVKGDNVKDILTKDEFGSVCLTMISAGLDNNALNLQYCMLQLSESQHICEKAFIEILNDMYYKGTNCTSRCTTSRNSEYSSKMSSRGRPSSRDRTCSRGASNCESQSRGRTRSSNSNNINNSSIYRNRIRSESASIFSLDSEDNRLSCDYISAIVKETLRLFTVLPVALPRLTTKDIIITDNSNNISVVIPQGTTLFMNSWSGNHDAEKFCKPNEFIPERFLIKSTKYRFGNGKDFNDNDSYYNEDNREDDVVRDGDASSIRSIFRDKYVINKKLKHLSFGIGSRMCLGNTLAFKEMYTLVYKIILNFNISRADDVLNSGVTKNLYYELNPLQINKFPDCIAIEPIERKIKLTIKEESEYLL